MKWKHFVIKYKLIFKGQKDKKWKPYYQLIFAMHLWYSRYFWHSKTSENHFIFVNRKLTVHNWLRRLWKLQIFVSNQTLGTYIRHRVKSGSFNFVLPARKQKSILKLRWTMQITWTHIHVHNLSCLNNFYIYLPPNTRMLIKVSSPRA